MQKMVLSNPKLKVSNCRERMRNGQQGQGMG